MTKYILADQQYLGIGKLNRNKQARRSVIILDLQNGCDKLAILNDIIELAKVQGLGVLSVSSSPIVAESIANQLDLALSLNVTIPKCKNVVNVRHISDDDTVVSIKVMLSKLKTPSNILLSDIEIENQTEVIHNLIFHSGNTSETKHKIGRFIINLNQQLNVQPLELETNFRTKTKSKSGALLLLQQQNKLYFELCKVLKLTGDGNVKVHKSDIISNSNVLVYLNSNSTQDILNSKLMVKYLNHTQYTLTDANHIMLLVTKILSFGAIRKPSYNTKSEILTLSENVKSKQTYSMFLTWDIDHSTQVINILMRFLYQSRKQ